MPNGLSVVIMVRLVQGVVKGVLDPNLRSESSVWAGLAVDWAMGKRVAGPGPGPLPDILLGGYGWTRGR